MVRSVTCLVFHIIDIPPVPEAEKTVRSAARSHLRWPSRPLRVATRACPQHCGACPAAASSFGSTFASDAVCAESTFRRAAVSCSVYHSIRRVYRNFYCPKAPGTCETVHSIRPSPSHSSLVDDTFCFGEPALVAEPALALTVSFIPRLVTARGNWLLGSFYAHLWARREQ